MNPAQLQAAIAVWQKARELQKAGKLREADAHFRKALQAMPKVPDLLADYARLAEQLGDWRAAENIWRAAQKAGPERNFGDHIGLALLQQERNDEARTVLEQHLQKCSSDVDSMINLAFCYTRLQLDAAAIDVLRHAVQLRPEHAHAQESLLTLLINSGLGAEAGIALEQALARLPDNPELHYMDMEHRLKSRDYAGGFDRFQARWHTRFVNDAVRLPKDRLWQGEAFSGKLLVRAEQGIGDELLYSGLLGDLQRVHAETVIDCDARLLPLFARSFPALTFIARDTSEQDPRRAGYARQCLMGDLPKMFRRQVADFPATAGWLQADAARRQAIARDYASRFPGKRLVGISWRSSHPGNGSAKSLTLDRLLPLLSVPGVQFVNLQYGDTQTEIDSFAARSGITIHRDAGVDPTRDLDGLAAQIDALDLVISTSNSTVHLAGALGKPVWVLLHRDRGLPWYWAYDGETVPWYPQTRLLRCAARGAWEPVIADAATRLAQRVQSGG